MSEEIKHTPLLNHRLADAYLNLSKGSDSPFTDELINKMRNASEIENAKQSLEIAKRYGAVKETGKWLKIIKKLEKEAIAKASGGSDA